MSTRKPAVDELLARITVMPGPVLTPEEKEWRRRNRSRFSDARWPANAGVSEAAAVEIGVREVRKGSSHRRAAWIAMQVFLGDENYWSRPHHIFMRLWRRISKKAAQPHRTNHRRRQMRLKAAGKNEVTR